MLTGQVCRSGQYAIDEFTAQCRKHHPLSAAVFSAAGKQSRISRQAGMWRIALSCT